MAFDWEEKMGKKDENDRVLSPDPPPLPHPVWERKGLRER